MHISKTRDVWEDLRWRDTLHVYLKMLIKGWTKKGSWFMECPSFYLPYMAIGPLEVKNRGKIPAQSSGPSLMNSQMRIWSVMRLCWHRILSYVCVYLLCGPQTICNKWRVFLRLQSVSPIFSPRMQHLAIFTCEKWVRTPLWSKCCVELLTYWQNFLFHEFPSFWGFLVQSILRLEDSLLIQIGYY